MVGHTLVAGFVALLIDDAGHETAIRTFKCKIETAAMGLLAAVSILAINSCSERAGPLSQTTLRTEISRRGRNRDK
jgi:hypothetical protein